MYHFFVILFLLKIRFPKQISIAQTIRNRYNHEILLTFRDLEHHDAKLGKVKLDLHFLNCCKTFGVFPKFLCFKLYRKTLYNTELYNRWRTKLLDQEIFHQTQQQTKLSNKLTQLKTNLYNSTSFIDYLALLHFIKRQTNKSNEQTKIIHNRKLNALGAKSSIQPCNSASLIHNLSSYTLSQRELFLLRFGLEFGLPVTNPNYFKHFLAYEKITSKLRSENPTTDFSVVKNIIQQHAVSSFSQAKKLQHNPFSLFTKSDINILKKLHRENSLVICKPDKGRGVVILNKSDYIDKMENIISDTSKFSKITTMDPFKLSLKYELKINDFLRKLKSNKTIDNLTYKSLYCSGTSLGTMYGLPKIHKENAPLRPILAAYNSPSYRIAKFLVPLLKPLTTNHYTIKNSYDFQKSISNITLPQNSFLTSYDVTSLFTMIPLQETIDIICSKVFSNTNNFHGFNPTDFRTLLTLACTDTCFLFNNNTYLQVDGVSMGSPLGPTLANISLCHHEEIWLNNCPDDYKPIQYYRYVDDNFTIFSNPDHKEHFFEYLNSRHPNFKFTMETERNNSLPFLDLRIFRQNNKLVTTVYRKPTFSGLGTSFFSNIPFLYKLNSIRTLIHRAYNLSSTYQSFTNELDFIRNFFSNNGFPDNIFHDVCNKFLNKIYSSTSIVATVPKKVIFLSLPYYTKNCSESAKALNKKLSIHFPHLDIRFSLTNKFTIASLFPFKDRLPADCRSNIIYKYTCECCNAFYVGSTKQKSKVRFCQHLGISHRTNLAITNPMLSLPRKHAQENNHQISMENFTIIDTANNSDDLILLESIYIKKLQPNINIQTNSSVLQITQ